MMDNNILDNNEQRFCQLYVNGGFPFSGNGKKCYEEIYAVSGTAANLRSKKLLSREDIRSYINQLDAENQQDAGNMKRYLTANLQSILEETATATYFDRRGTALSPAPLRSVAVSAAKALMEMYPVREAQVNKLNIESDGEGGITFNVIVPNTKPETPKTDD